METSKHELISIIQRGSWYTVTFLAGGRLIKFKTQGIAKTREAITYYGVKHTLGNTYLITAGIDLNFFLENSKKC